MTIGKVRPAVQAMAAYRPGKGAKQAEADHGITDAIKLASNENPYPVAAGVQAAIDAASGSINRYNDHRATELRARLAKQLHVAPERVTVGSGSVGLLQQIAMTYLDPGDEAVYPWLSFEAYPVFTALMAATSVQVPLVDHAFDVPGIIEAVTDRTKVIFLATPNNPTGTAISTTAIDSVLMQIPSDVIVVVDEAYREFSQASLGDPVSLVEGNDNLIVLRTFSKAYGLAGVRVGYGVGHPDVVAELDKVLLAFAVNGLAQAAALAALDARDEIQPNIDAIIAERDRVRTALIAAGLAVPDSQGNFVYVPLGERTDDVHLALERAGVVTRPFSGQGIRVTIGTPEQNDRFLTSLNEAMS